MKATFLLGACLFLLSIYIKTGCGDTKIIRSKRTLTGQSSQETFTMFIREQGSHFNEKVTFDKAKKTVTYHVPAHRDLSEADVLIDFNSNITVTRLPGKDVCYVRPRSPDEPSMELLKKSMEKVSTGKYKIRSGSRLYSAEWTPAGRADLTKLSENIIEFCRGLPINELKKIEKDEITVSGGITRTKRQAGMTFPFCKDPSTGYTHLQHCARENYITRCKFSSRSCVYWVTCDGGIRSTNLRNAGLCNANHQTVNALCCDLDCPKTYSVF